MNYLTAEQVIFIHSVIITKTGGSHGIRDLGLLQSAIARPMATFEGQELYPDLFYKTAALLDSLINNHPFTDGNKRTGIIAASLALRINNWMLNANNDELENFALDVATSHPKIEELANWLKTHSREI